MSFKVGDKVIVINDSNYFVTKNGSVGIVLETGRYGVRCDWLKLTGEYSDTHLSDKQENNSWVINPIYLRLLTPLDEAML